RASDTARLALLATVEILDRDIVRVSFREAEDDPVLVVDSNTVEARTVMLQALEVHPRQAKVTRLSSDVEHIKLAPCCRPRALWQLAAGSLGIDTVVNI